MKCNMSDLDDIAAFVAVADAGGLAAAEAATGQTRANLSRALKRLEGRLGVVLARRTPQAFTLTDAGARYHREVRAVLRGLERADAAAGAEAVQTVRMTTPTLLGHTGVAEALARYRRDHPDVRLIVHVTNEKLDLVGGRIDVALRTGDAKGEALVARTLFEGRERLFASAAYLDRAGRPSRPADLRDHATIHCTPSSTFEAKPVWDLTDGEDDARVELRDALVVNDPGTACRLAHHGAGIARITDFLGARSVADGTLEAVLPNWSTAAVPVRAVILDGRNASKPVRALVDILAGARWV